jgi:hypothetical protein
VHLPVEVELVCAIYDNNNIKIIMIIIKITVMTTTMMIIMTTTCTKALGSERMLSSILRKLR